MKRNFPYVSAHDQRTLLHPLTYGSSFASTLCVGTKSTDRTGGDKEKLIIGYGDNRLSVRSVKLFTDGELGRSQSDTPLTRTSQARCGRAAQLCMSLIQTTLPHEEFFELAQKCFTTSFPSS